jgi:hypothetical protein
MESGSGSILPMHDVKLLIKNVSLLLHSHWDPIGVNDDPESRGEYENYAPKIAGMIISKESPRSIASELERIQVEVMGLNSSPAESLIAVKKILSDPAIDRWR